MTGRLYGLLFLILAVFSSPSWSGEIGDDLYRAERFGTLLIPFVPGAWLPLDREASGDNDYGGPIVELKALQPIDGVLPSILVSGFKRVEASVTPEFILRTTVDTMRDKGAEPGPVLTRTVDGKKLRFFDAKVVKGGQESRLYYVLLTADDVLFAVQCVVPVRAFEATRKVMDKLVDGMSY